MRKSIFKTISILFLMLMISISFTSPVFATDGDKKDETTSTSTGILTSADYNDITFSAATLKDTGVENSVTGIIGAIIRVTQIIGLGVAIIMLLVLAIKYIAASPNDKAEIKKHIVVYVVGAIILFSAAGILEIVRRFAVNSIKPGDASTTTEAPKE